MLDRDLLERSTAQYFYKASKMWKYTYNFYTSNYHFMMVKKNHLLQNLFQIYKKICCLLCRDRDNFTLTFFAQEMTDRYTEA
jgi:hypothetical protein